MVDIAINVVLAAGVLAVIFVVFRFVFNVIPSVRIARQHCPTCEKYFGVNAARAGVDFYERLFGKGTKVMEDACVYNGTRVVTCGDCKAEFVFSEFGRLLEPFEPAKYDGSVVEN